MKGLNLKPFVDKFHFFFTQFSFRSINEMDEKKPLSNFFKLDALRKKKLVSLWGRRKLKLFSLKDKGTCLLPQQEKD